MANEATQPDQKLTSSHTPGPWSVEEGHIQRDSGGIRYWQVTDGQDAIACNQFCYANYKSETSEANARLIAAAPDLLEALLRIRATLDGKGYYTPYITAALAKAGAI